MMSNVLIHRIHEKYTDVYSVSLLLSDIVYSSFKDTVYDTTGAKEAIHRSIAGLIRDSTADVLMATVDNTVIGVGIGTEHPRWYDSCTRDFSELIIAVRADAHAMTKARVLSALIGALEKSAVERGCKCITIGTSSGVKTASYTRMLTKRGYVHSTNITKKELVCAAEVA